MPGGKVRLGASIDGNDALLINRIVPLVDLVEIAPDRWANFRSGQVPRIEEPALTALSEVGCIRPLSFHGVGLSIASYDDWNWNYICLLDQILGQSFPVAWHSEHLSFSRVDGEALGTMVEPPWTHEALDLISNRVCVIQDRYNRQFLLEHVARAFPEGQQDEMDGTTFLNSLIRQTGCGLLLDVYNLECDYYNFGIDPLKFLDALDLDAVREIHVAGGPVYRGYKMDIHSRVIADSTLALLDHVLNLASHVEVVVFEVLKEAIPSMGIDVLTAELTRLRGVLDARA